MGPVREIWSLVQRGASFFGSTMRRFIKYHFPSFQSLSLSHFFQEATLSVLLKDELGDDDLVFLRAGGHHTCNHVPML